MSDIVAWSIFLAPLTSFFLIGLVIRPFMKGFTKLSGYVIIAALGISLLLSLIAFRSVVADGPYQSAEYAWLHIGDLVLNVGLHIDALTVVMIVVVSFVSLLVQVYSQGYMDGDPGYHRYFAYMSLFTASMLGLVMARNLVQLFVFWELVGACSYLLIGFWFHRPSAAAAAKKAFLVTRIGDFGFLLGLLYLFGHRAEFLAEGLNVLDILDIHYAAEMGYIAVGTATWVSVGMLAGAVGKSGQFPLHTWLPDAMEGPTPVSSLIHAATMVAAGVFLVARMLPLFEVSGSALQLVAIVGAFTALFAASMGLVMNDIKRVLAYSTVSQLGYMMLALGIGAYVPALFHLATHAFFKCLLFLGSGSVNHATGTFDMRYMGGLRKVMPVTYVVFTIGSLSLAGIFPLAGFWSKDEIFANLRSESLVLLVVAVIAAFLTAAYITRVVLMTFHGSFRGGADSDPNADAPVHLRESPMIMVIPMIILAVVTVVAGVLANPVIDLGGIPVHWLTENVFHEHADHFDVLIAAISTVVSVSGIMLGYFIYKRGLAENFVSLTLGRRLSDIVSRKYYLDELYEDIIVRSILYRGVFRALAWFDMNVIDRIGDAIGWQGRNMGKILAVIQTGQTQIYMGSISLGLLALFTVLIMRGI
jgi:NADH-quinone oxidoreductase subunit L